MNTPDPMQIFRNSTVLADSDEVKAAVERMSSAVNEHYENREIILLVVMTGAVMPAAWLAARLKMPLQMDFVHATRYTGQTEGGEGWASWHRGRKEDERGDVAGIWCEWCGHAVHGRP